MKAVHDIEVIPLPGTVRVEEVGGKERQDCLINSGLIVSHVPTLSLHQRARNVCGLTPELSRPTTREPGVELTPQQRTCLQLRRSGFGLNDSLGRWQVE